MNEHPSLNNQPFFDNRNLSFMKQVKEEMWRLVRPMFPALRGAFTSMGLGHPPKKRDFFIGHLAANRTAVDLEDHLVRQGFEQDPIAWKEEGEVMSLRRRVSFEYQYHIRLFDDGELCGHFELTVESNPRAHLAEKEFYDKKAEFLEFLGDWVAS